LTVSRSTSWSPPASLIAATVDGETVPVPERSCFWSM